MADNNGKLSWKQRRFSALLGFPVFGISLAYTVTTTYPPRILHQLSGPAETGLLIGAEGIFALFVPIIAGEWSDSVRTRIGGACRLYSPEAPWPYPPSSSWLLARAR